MIYEIVSAVHVVAALASTGHLLLKYQRPQAAVAWLFALWVIPLLGSLLYLLIGVYEQPRKFRRKRDRVVAVRTTGRSDVHPGDGYPDDFPMPQLARVVDRLAPFPLSGGHRISIFPSGDAAFEGMLQAMARAEREIFVSTYIFEPGPTTERLREVLADRVKHGVDVRLLYDQLGSFLTPTQFVQSFKDLGIETLSYLKANPIKGRFQINFRNHRKLLIVDHEIGFTGGQNWTDAHSERNHGKDPLAKDLHAEVRGPAVAALRRVFLEDWCLAKESPIEDEWPPPPQPDGDLAVRVLPHGPDEETDRLVTIFESAAQQAQKDILLVSPFFVPGTTLIETLRASALGGVRVRLLLPRRSDHISADYAAWRHFERLLKAGVEIWLRDEVFLHAKVFVVDGAWSSFGSTNFDQRSFYCNYELNLEVVGEEFARRITSCFDEHFERAHRVTMAEYRARPLWKRVLTNAAALFEPIL